MKRMLLYGCLALLLLLPACSSQSKRQEVELPAQTGLNPRSQALLTSTWPKIKNELPGLQKYGAAMKAVKVDDMLQTPDSEYKKLAVELVIQDGGSAIPSEYKAMGNHCYIDIMPDGKSIVINKRACKAALLDRNISGTEHDNTEPLKVQLK